MSRRPNAMDTIDAARLVLPQWSPLLIMRACAGSGRSTAGATTAVVALPARQADVVHLGRPVLESIASGAAISSAILWDRPVYWYRVRAMRVAKIYGMVTLYMQAQPWWWWRRWRWRVPAATHLELQGCDAV